MTAVSDAGLGSVIASTAGGAEVEILERRPLEAGGSHGKELVSCSIGNTPSLTMLVKHGTARAHRSHGHYKGVEYEGAVYADVLKPLEASVPALYGYDPGSGSANAWIAIEYLKDALKVNCVPDPWAMPGAARWIGALQRRAEPLVPGLLPGMHRYDARYYAGWARRTSRFAAEFADDPSLLRHLCQTFVESTPALAARTPTLVHGEYYPCNILAVDGAIRPVDWESTAVGLGEIDIAMLIEAWPRDVAAECLAAYWGARWPTGPPDDAGWALDMARLYVQFRWLGDCERRTQRESPATRVQALEATARRLELREAASPRLAGAV